ncbi:hypothetical protein [uncultured Clostridium sp.]|uniref:prenylated flavin chaperone LpdD n=1 Tax=uncultured Clostridium sp. TaxID=59620 RepID=UPI0025E99741|nr:hypothetical protein [uncultured Clostridium sp.]
MKRVTYRQTVLNYPITAEISVLNQGIHILLVGGMKTHIGAVSICSADGLHTMEEDGHRESAVSARWAQALFEVWGCPVTVACGIHYDYITKEKIGLILDETEVMLEQVEKLTEVTVHR